MTTVLIIVTVTTAVAILALHILSVFGQSLRAKIAAYICIALHVILFTCLLLLGTEISKAVLAFMISVLWYTVLWWIRIGRDNRRAGVSQEEHKQ